MSIPVNIFGAYKHSDLPSLSVLDATESKVMEAINAFLAQEDLFLNQMLALLTSSGTDVQTRFDNGGGGEFQTITDVGGVEATKTGGFWDVGFPIYAFGDRTLYTQSYLDEATLADINRDVVDKTLKDITTVMKMVNRAILNNANFTFDDSQWPGRRMGSINVYRLANNDGSDGEIYTSAGRVGIGSLQHYITSGSSTLDEGAFTAARDKLRNVGHDDKIIYLVSKATADSAEGLSNFVKPQQPGIVSPTATYSIVSSPRARGMIAHGEVWEWPHFPDGYIFAFDPSKAKPVRLRQHHLAKYQGLALVQDDRAGEIPNRPLVNKYWRRILGAGVYNRVNGVVVQVSSGGSYTAPTNALV